MKFMYAIVISMLLVTNSVGQVTVTQGDGKTQYYELKDGELYDAGSMKVLRAVNLDKKEKGNIDILVANRENYSVSGMGIVNNQIRFKNAVKLADDHFILLGNVGETWTIKLTYVKDNVPVDEYAEPITIAAQQPVAVAAVATAPAFDGVADKISNLAMPISTKDRDEVIKYYSFLIDGINNKRITTVDHLAAAISSYQIKLENFPACKAIFDLITNDGSKRNLSISQMAEYYAEIVKGFQQAPPAEAPPLNPSN